jgi:hypothetical protein
MFAIATNKMKINNENTTIVKKNIGGLVINWKFRVSIENRQTKILIMKIEK